jgi:hypothetical protein
VSEEVSSDGLRTYIYDRAPQTRQRGDLYGNRIETREACTDDPKLVDSSSGWLASPLFVAAAPQAPFLGLTSTSAPRSPICALAVVAVIVFAAAIAKLAAACKFRRASSPLPSGQHVGPRQPSSEARRRHARSLILNRKLKSSTCRRQYHVSSRSTLAAY